MRGGLSTRDHDYGIFNNIHHDIGTHVVHHLFPQVRNTILCSVSSDKNVLLLFCCRYAMDSSALLFLTEAVCLRCCLDAALPHRGSDQSGEAGAWGILQGAREVWTYPVPPHQAVFQGGGGERACLERALRDTC